MQPNYVNKEEFGRFSQKIDKKFDEQKDYMDGGFKQAFKQIDAVESHLGKKIDLLAGDVSWLKRSMGKVLINMDKVMDKLGVS